MKFTEEGYFNTEEPGLEGENTGNNQETLGNHLQNIDEEKVEHALDSLREVLFDEEKIKQTNELWGQRYKEDPSSFWEQESIKFLKTLSVGERIQLLKRASRFLQMSPSDTFLYTQNFPEDISAFALYLDEEGGPTTSFEFKLTGLLATRIEQTYDFLKNKIWLRQPKEIEERRKLAKDHILLPEEFYLGDMMQEQFPELKEEYFKVLWQAIELDINGYERLDLQNMFGEQFQQMSLEKRLSFLQYIVARLHNILVESEVFNSAFTKESNLRSRGIDRTYGYNVAHSMLFKTRQPSRAYELAQQTFSYEMNNTAAIGGYVEEYPFHRMLLETLKKIKEEFLDNQDIDDAQKSEKTKLLVDFWNKNRNPIFANATAECLSVIDSTHASQLLLEKIKQESDDKTALVAMLYRLEFGQIGISVEGVKYLERMYDLGEFNNPDYFVNRLTARGEIGIFDGQNNLIRYFQLEDFEESDKQKVIQPAVLEFAYDTLFVPKEGETKKEREQRIQFLEEFKKSYFGFYDEKFLEKTGVRFNNLTFKEQGAFLLFSKAVPEETNEKLTDFCKAQGEAGLRLFLMINRRDFTLGQRLLKMTEVLDPKITTLVAEKLSGILAQLERVSDFVESDPILKEATKQKLPVIQSKIVEKAVNILDNILQVQDQEDIEEKILTQLKNINAEAVLLGSTLSTMRHVGITADMAEGILSGFSETGLFTYEVSDFTNSDLRQIEEIYDLNYRDTPLLKERLYEGFLKTIKEGNTYYEVIKSKGKIVALCGFQHLSSGKVYFGKFNVHPAYRGSEIGSEMMDMTLERYAQTNIVYADCNIEAPVSANYIERGFVAIRGYDMDETKSLEIVRNDSYRDLFNSKDWTEYYISSQAKQGERVSLNSGKQVILSQDIKDIKNVTLDALEQENSEYRYVITRYVRDKESGKVHLVFERVKKDTFEKYKEERRNLAQYDTDRVLIL